MSMAREELTTATFRKYARGDPAHLENMQGETLPIWPIRLKVLITLFHKPTTRNVLAVTYSNLAIITMSCTTHILGCALIGISFYSRVVLLRKGAQLTRGVNSPPPKCSLQNAYQWQTSNINII